MELLSEYVKRQRNRRRWVVSIDELEPDSYRTPLTERLRDFIGQPITPDFQNRLQRTFDEYFQEMQYINPLYQPEYLYEDHFVIVPGEREFRLSHIPEPSSVLVWINETLAHLFDDYTLVGDTIVFSESPNRGDLRVQYLVRARRPVWN
ncbi:hypothetical protein [Alicyclobacillus shizuokensis]|uniref:hypothetical protein n=1 Tax=Alicyclobacillus shizuokensis TaxID=392014 RepID=UPI000834682E|nr:hypothetical protein [Alicyclobacillus shizuokensis]